MKPEISIIMSVYNTNEKWLTEAIESILNQTYHDFEFVIVLDCPTDSSKDIVKEYQSRDKRIVVIENEKNLGTADSLNIALKNCRYEYVARMDSDDIAEKYRLEKQLDYLLENNYDLIASSMNYINEKSELLNIEATLIDERKINEILKYENVMHHPTWLVRKRVYDDLGGYRNFKLVEDYDFLLRCLRHNYRIGYMNEKVLSYRYMSKNYESNSLARQYISGVYLSENMDRIDSITRAQLDDYLDKITAKYSNKAFWNAVDSSNKVASSIYYRNYVDAFKAFFEYRGYECPVLTYIMTRRKYRSIKIKWQ